MTRPADPATAEVWLATPAAAPLLDPSKLSAADRAEWDALQTPRRREDWASSRVLLGAVPASDDQASSLSHSHGFAALARSPGHVAVGVDVEWLAGRDFVSMARTAYSSAEADELASLGDPAALRGRFYEAWTFKEAFAKALRLPLADALSRCCFTGADGAATARVPTGRAWSATVFAPQPQLRLAVVLVAGDGTVVPSVIRPLEWPPGRAVAWPVVRRLAGRGGVGASEC